MKKRLLTLTLTLALTLALLPLGARAATPQDLGTLELDLSSGNLDLTNIETSAALLDTLNALGPERFYQGDPYGLDLDGDGTLDVLLTEIGILLELVTASSPSVYTFYPLTLEQSDVDRLTESGAPAYYSKVEFLLPLDPMDDYVPGVIPSDTVDLTDSIESRPVEDFYAVVNTLLAAGKTGVIGAKEQGDSFIYDLDKDGTDDLMGFVSPDGKTTTLQLLVGYSVEGKRTITVSAQGIAYMTRIHSPCYCEELTILLPQPAPPLPFTDVKESDFFYEAVQWAVENGVTSGTTATTFEPGSVCNRAQVVTFLWRAVGEPAPKSESNPFRDVKPSDYYYKAVLWASENGITSGSAPGQFDPDGACNRAQVVTFLFRTMRASVPEDQTNPFTDVKTTDYFYGPVLWASAAGVTSGTTPTTFSPTQSCNRGQVVTFLFRALGGTWTKWESTP